MIPGVCAVSMQKEEQKVEETGYSEASPNGYQQTQRLQI